MSDQQGDAAPRITPFFLNRGGVNLFCLWVQPAVVEPGGRAVVHCAAFGEEMNKSRFMVSSVARDAAGNGVSTLIMDLSGTGDSEGDLTSASWEDWCDDISAALAWVGRQGIERICLWGVRLGASLALAVAKKDGALIDRLMLWQPVLNGGLFWKQFLRLRTASEMLSDIPDRGTQDLDEELATRGHAEIAGYPVTAGWIQSLTALRYDRETPMVDRIGWFEVSALNPPELAVAAGKTVAGWRAAGIQIDDFPVTGEPFWGTSEISFCEKLVSRSVRYLCDG